MTYETLLEKAHGLVDSMSEARLENFVMRYGDTVSAKKTLSAENIDEMLSRAAPGDFGENPALIQRFRELTKMTCGKIATLKKIDGTLPPRICGYVIEWALLHQSELQNNWQSLQRDGTFEKIMPLV